MGGLGPPEPYCSLRFPYRGIIMNNAQTHLKMGYVWTICLVAACGGLLFGYDWVV
ncbi:MFS transporter, partial [Klebsiella pneumoniae]